MEAEKKSEELKVEDKPIEENIGSKPEEAKAETPKAEEAKAEAPKAEEAKAEAPKAEEAKAEGPKAEEAKAEAPKAEETKAGDKAETKPEDTKPESAKATEGAPTHELTQPKAAQQTITKKVYVRKKKKKHVLRNVVWALVGVLFVVYLIGVFNFRNRFIPYTYINGLDCSNLETYDVILLLENQCAQYAINIEGITDSSKTTGTIITLTAKDFDYKSSNNLVDVQALMGKQDPFEWPGCIFKIRHDEILEHAIEYDESMLKQALLKSDCLCNVGMKKAENAYISDYLADKNRYEVIPEIEGTEVDFEKVYACVKEAIDKELPQINLVEADCYKKAEITSDNEKLTDAVTEVNKWLRTRIEYDWNGETVVLDGPVINEWVKFDGINPVLDEEAVYKFISQNAAKCDTYGKNRTFTTVHGFEITLPSGAYGWQTDKDAECESLLKEIYNGEEITKEPIYRFTGYAKGINDIGNSYVEVDLTNQHLYLFIDGQIVLESDFVSGDVHIGNTTPPGVFGITYKTRDAVLRGANYETPVNYWMPFNGNIGMHDATWRREFGGEIYLSNGSHGCINLPLQKAKEIYEYMEERFPVVCYYYNTQASEEEVIN